MQFKYDAPVHFTTHYDHFNVIDNCEQRGYCRKAYIFRNCPRLQRSNFQSCLL